ncbi:sugar phosphate isomerase/epimerase [Deinobacterium chartae]|uniref:Sugar phosphate isomerase/epimerase n=1 Tax=Deinobacterium chartae TaxID=521158 RepID=A0A841I2V5_9DEIO|nr:sugar phosphate isomerase/epimerase [Deinobacterium chartae]MBB6098372.1 sugar phosphate isomerase/epimerase [Deinobacterium chartae]
MPEIAVQLYTLRHDLARDFPGTLSALARLGIRHVEFAGHYGDHGPESLRALLDELGLSVPSLHLQLIALETDFQRQVHLAHALGASHVVVPWWRAEDTAGWEDLRARLEALAPRVAEAGLRLAYHNHAHELSERLQGQPVLDALLEVPGLGAEIDVAWVHAGGYDPAAYLTRYRPDLVHLKDARQDGERWQTVPLGQGEVPLEAALRASQGAAYWIIEQDECQGPALEAVAASLNHLRALA